jgi:hypothetical protein
MTVLQWQESYGVAKLGIDVRRFISFGIFKVRCLSSLVEPRSLRTKGFLRRIHRWPYLLPLDTTNVPTPAAGAHFIPLPPVTSPLVPNGPSLLSPTSTFLVEEPFQGPVPSPPGPSVLSRSAEERLGVLSKRRIRERTISSTATSDGPSEPGSHEARRKGSYLSTTTISTISTISTASAASGGPTSAVDWPRQSFPSPGATPRLSTISLPPAPPRLVPPFGLAELLDGEHHTDELCTRFKAGWPIMKKYLATIGNHDPEPKADGLNDLGRVKIIYR